MYLIVNDTDKKYFRNIKELKKNIIKRAWGRTSKKRRDTVDNLVQSSDSFTINDIEFKVIGYYVKHESEYAIIAERDEEVKVLHTFDLEDNEDYNHYIKEYIYNNYKEFMDNSVYYRVSRNNIIFETIDYTVEFGLLMDECKTLGLRPFEFYTNLIHETLKYVVAAIAKSKKLPNPNKKPMAYVQKGLSMGYTIDEINSTFGLEERLEHYHMGGNYRNWIDRAIRSIEKDAVSCWDPWYIRFNRELSKLEIIERYREDDNYGSIFKLFQLYNNNKLIVKERGIDEWVEVKERDLKRVIVKKRYGEISWVITSEDKITEYETMKEALGSISKEWIKVDCIFTHDNFIEVNKGINSNGRVIKSSKSKLVGEYVFASTYKLDSLKDLGSFLEKEAYIDKYESIDFILNPVGEYKGYYVGNKDSRLFKVEFRKKGHIDLVEYQDDGEEWERRSIGYYTHGKATITEEI